MLMNPIVRTLFGIILSLIIGWLTALMSRLHERTPHPLVSRWSFLRNVIVDTNPEGLIIRSAFEPEQAIPLNV